MTVFFSILVLLSSLTVIISVVLQEGSSEGMGTVMGGSGGSLFSKTRGKTRDDILKRITIVSSVILMISTLVLAAK